MFDGILPEYLPMGRYYRESTKGYNFKHFFKKDVFIEGREG